MARWLRSFVAKLARVVGVSPRQLVLKRGKAWESVQKISEDLRPRKADSGRKSIWASDATERPNGTKRPSARLHALSFLVMASRKQWEKKGNSEKMVKIALFATDFVPSEMIADSTGLHLVAGFEKYHRDLTSEDENERVHLAHLIFRRSLLFRWTSLELLDLYRELKEHGRMNADLEAVADWLFKPLLNSA